MSSAAAIPILIHKRREEEVSENDNVTTYINLRIVTYDTNKDGKREIIIVKNISTTARTFQRLKLFSSAEVY